MSRTKIGLILLFFIGQITYWASEPQFKANAQGDERTPTPTRVTKLTPTNTPKPTQITPSRTPITPSATPTATPASPTSASTQLAPGTTPTGTQETELSTGSPTAAYTATATITGTIAEITGTGTSQPGQTPVNQVAAPTGDVGQGDSAALPDEPKRPPKLIFVWGSKYRFILILILLLLVAAPFVIGRLWNNPKPPPAQGKAGSGDAGQASRPVGSPKFTDLVLERGITLSIDDHGDLDMYLVNAPGGPAPPPVDDPTYSAGHFVLDLDRSPVVHETMHAITQAYQAQFHAPLRLKLKLLEGRGGVELSKSLRSMIDTVSMNNSLDPAEVETALKDLGRSAGTSGQRGGGEGSLPGVTIYVDLND